VALPERGGQVTSGVARLGLVLLHAAERLEDPGDERPLGRIVRGIDVFGALQADAAGGRVAEDPAQSAQARLDSLDHLCGQAPFRPRPLDFTPKAHGRGARTRSRAKQAATPLKQAKTSRPPAS